MTSGRPRLAVSRCRLRPSEGLLAFHGFNRERDPPTRGPAPRYLDSRYLDYWAVYLFGAVGPECCAKDLVMPDTITAVLLPPCSPELNAIERLWLYLKERFLSHRLWPDHDAIVDAVCQAWQRVTSDTGRVKSLSSMERATTVKTWRACGLSPSSPAAGRARVPARR